MRRKEGEKVDGHVVKTSLEFYFDTYVCTYIMDMYAVLDKVDSIKKQLAV